MKIKIKKLRPDAILPQFQSIGASCMDLHSCIEDTMFPGMVRSIPCGFALELPEGYEAQIRPRSGLAAKKRVTLANSLGTVDQDFRGEIMALLINHGSELFRIHKGDRIAQLWIGKAGERVEWEEVAELEETERSAGGFGSTGVR